MSEGDRMAPIERSSDNLSHLELVTDDAGYLRRQLGGARAEVERLREAAKRVLEADMLGVRDLDALNALEDAAGFSQQGQRRG